MSVVSLAIIGKSNKPLYLREFDNDAIDEAELFGLDPAVSVSDPSELSCSLRQQFILHAALDRFEQLAGPPPECAWRAPGVTGTDAMFVGQLCSLDDVKLFGYMTTTNHKFLMAVRDGYHEEIQKLFASLHAHFVAYTMNPFSPINAPILSKKFDAQLQTTISEYNRSME